MLGRWFDSVEILDKLRGWGELWKDRIIVPRTISKRSNFRQTNPNSWGLEKHSFNQLRLFLTIFSLAMRLHNRAELWCVGAVWVSVPLPLSNTWHVENNCPAKNLSVRDSGPLHNTHNQLLFHFSYGRLGFIIEEKLNPFRCSERVRDSWLFLVEFGIRKTNYSCDSCLVWAHSISFCSAFVRWKRVLYNDPCAKKYGWICCFCLFVLIQYRHSLHTFLIEDGHQRYILFLV